MDKEQKDPYKLDLTKPRLASYKQKKRRRHQDTVYWVDIQLAQRKGLKFYQTRCNAIILCDTLPAYCISKVVVMESGEIIYEKVYVSPRPPPTISFKDNWMKELDSEVAGGNVQPKTKNPIVRTVRPVSEQPAGSFTQEIRKDALLGRESTNSRTVRPVEKQTIQPELCASVCWTRRQKRRRRRKRRRRSNKNGETREWTTTRFVHSARGNRNWLQSVWIATCSCEKSRKLPRSRTREEDRKSSSPRSTSSRLAAEQRLQPIQQQFESDDPRIGQCRVIRAVWNYTKSTMFSLSSLLESRNCLAHMRTILGWKRIQKKG